METSSGPKGASNGASFTRGRHNSPVAVFRIAERAIASLPKVRLNIRAMGYHLRGYFPLHPSFYLRICGKKLAITVTEELSSGL